MSSRHNRLERNPITFNILAYGTVGLMAIAGVLPFWMLLIGSFTDNATIIREGFSLWPSQFSLDAYRVALRAPEIILRAYIVTIGITVVGSAIVIVITAITAYALSRQEFRYRNIFSFFFYFPALFSGGLIPFYLLMLNLGMRNNYFAMILPAIGNFFYIVILRSYFKSLPAEIGESGRIDGAHDLTICFRLYMPMAVPALATVGLFSSLGYWNEWFNAMLFISDQNMFPLQFILRRVMDAERIMGQFAQSAEIPRVALPSESIKLAVVCLATGPIFLLFPYIQKYFIKGLTVGAVKG